MALTSSSRNSEGQLDFDLVRLIQDGLPLVERPYQELSKLLGVTEEEIIAALRAMLEEGKIKRIGSVPNHYALGILANGMTVWDIPDGIVGEVGARLGRQPEVTHCYRRPRHPGWPYNLFAMIHGRSRDEVLATIDRISRDLSIDAYPREVLFSRRLLKKTGIRLTRSAR